jgi:prevent-host-death family protein
MKDLPMRSVSVAQAKAQLPSLLQAAEAGENIIITRHGRPVAEVRGTGGFDIDPNDRHGLKWLAERRAKRTPLLQSAVELIREMRQADDH